ncbi:hypothetical protein BT69DRAFT_1297905 [Atractiella rhizophila]|nr:hypothetical protein BT69DRAFT_1297905 [Atractiella rhizophila]
MSGQNPKSLSTFTPPPSKFPLQRRPNPDTLKRNTACNNCKARRVKCDAGRPACSRCVTLARTRRVAIEEINCTYPQSQTSMYSDTQASSSQRHGTEAIRKVSPTTTSSASSTRRASPSSTRQNASPSAERILGDRKRAGDGEAEVGDDDESLQSIMRDFPSAFHVSDPSPSFSQPAQPSQRLGYTDPNTLLSPQDEDAVRSFLMTFVKDFEGNELER